MTEIRVSRIPRPAQVSIALIAWALAGTGARAADTVDLQVLPRDRVQGTLRPADERESFYVAGLRGSKVTAVAKRVGSGSPAPTLALLDAAGLIGLADAKPTSSGAKLRTYVLTATDAVRFRIAGDGALDGDYQLDLTTSPRTAWDGKSDADLDPAAEATFAFAAPRDAKATITVRRSGRAALEPILLDLTGPRGEVIAADGVARSTSADTITVASLPSPGEWTLRFRNDGDVAGAWKASVRLSRTKYARKTVDLRDTALAGAFAGSQAVVGRIAETDQATFIEGTDGLGLDGVAITIPAGAVTLPTLVTISQDDEFFVDDDANAAGTTAKFSPAGTQFAIPATVTLPFDASSYDDATTELSIVVENAETGEQETIAATSVDTATSTATFPASHFSRFQPISRKPRPFRGRYVDVALRGAALADFGGTFSMSMDRIDATTGPRTPRPIDRRLDGQTISWSRTPAGDDADFDAAVSKGTQAGVAGILSNTTVRLVSATDDITIRRGRDPRLYASMDADASGVAIHYVLDRPFGKPTAGNLEGGWHGLVLEFGGVRADPAGVDLTLASQRFELDVSADGTATASAVLTSLWRHTYPLTAWDRRIVKRAPKPGTLLPADEAAALTMKLGADNVLDTVELLPVLGGDALIGVAHRRGGAPMEDANAAVSRLVVLVRRDTDGAAADLIGQFLTTAFAVLPENRDGAPSTVGFETTVAVRSHDELRVGLGVKLLATHDGAGAAVLPAPASFSNDFTFTLGADGGYRVKGPAIGGFAAAGRPILFLTADLLDRATFGLGTPVKPAALGMKR